MSIPLTPIVLASAIPILLSFPSVANLPDITTFSTLSPVLFITSFSTVACFSSCPTSIFTFLFSSSPIVFTFNSFILFVVIIPVGDVICISFSSVPVCALSL